MSAGRTLKRGLGVVAKLFGPTRHYQGSRALGTQERWEIIAPRLTGMRSLLDVGCAGGVMTRLAADAGLFAVGVEVKSDVVRWARRRTADGQSAAFMHYRLTPESVERLPVFDAVLCLSVHHRWHREFGGAAAREMLRAVGSRARHRLFFEPASRRGKYGRTPPAFLDGDEPSIVEHNRTLLADLFGGPEAVEFLGASVCIGSEPYRYLFMVHTDQRHRPHR